MPRAISGRGATRAGTGALRTWLGSGVRRRRRDQNWTQRDLAERAKVNLAQVNRIERGGNVTLETLGRIVDALEWDVSTELADAPPATVDVRGALTPRLRRVNACLGRLLIRLEEEPEVVDHGLA